MKFSFFLRALRKLRIPIQNCSLMSGIPSIRPEKQIERKFTLA